MNSKDDLINEIVGKYSTREKLYHGECGGTVVESVLKIYNVTGEDAGKVKCVATVHMPRPVTLVKTFNFIVQCELFEFRRGITRFFMRIVEFSVRLGYSYSSSHI